MQPSLLRVIVTLDTQESEEWPNDVSGCVDWWEGMSQWVVRDEVTARLSDVLNTFLFATFLIFDVLYIVFEK